MDSMLVDNYIKQSRMRELQDALDYAMKNVERNTKSQFVIAFCGIFSSGKSSLLNEILKQDFKLPTGGEPVTKFVTRIEYGKAFKAYYIDAGDRVYLEENVVKDLVCGKSKLSVKCQEIVLQMPAEILKHNIVLLDTPGYEDDRKLEEITRKAVRSADMAVFCCNADHFGRRFEQGYFQELEDSLGNYIVVVNHADVIHTDEEFEKLKQYVEETIDNRGSRKLKPFCDRTLFFTVGAGRYIDLDGLDICLSTICKLPKEDAAKIIEYASLKKLLYSSTIALPVIEEEIDEGKELYENVYRTIQLEYEAARDKYERKEKDVKKTLEQFRGYIRDVVYSRIDRVSNRIEQLETDGKHSEFVSLSAQILKNQFSSLPGDVKLWKEKHPILKGKNLDLFSSDLNQLLNSYRVPQPVGQQVRNRGVIGSLLVSGIVSTLTLSPYWDDGYDTEYHGYAKAAQSNIKSSFLSKLNKIIDKYLNDLYTTSKPVFQPPDASILDVLKHHLDEVRKLHEEVEYYISRIGNILNRNRKILICSSSFGCGRSTLLNALIKKDLIKTGFDLFPSITTIVKASGLGHEEKVIYTYPAIDQYGNRKEVEQPFTNDIIGKALEKACSVRYDELEESIDWPLYRTLFLDNQNRHYEYIDLQRSVSGDCAFEDSMTLEFLCKADAIVYVMDALHPFLMEERQTVSRFFEGKQLKNVFFAINKVNLIGENGAELQKNVKKQLFPVFADSKGVFDDNLYMRRVFFIDAYGALNARMGRKTPVAPCQSKMVLDVETGVPELEKALYSFLEQQQIT